MKPEEKSSPGGSLRRMAAILSVVPCNQGQERLGTRCGAGSLIWIYLQCVCETVRLIVSGADVSRVPLKQEPKAHIPPVWKQEPLWNATEPREDTSLCQDVSGFTRVPSGQNIPASPTKITSCDVTRIQTHQTDKTNVRLGLPYCALTETATTQSRRGLRPPASAPSGGRGVPPTTRAWPVTHSYLYFVVITMTRNKGNLVPSKCYIIFLYHILCR